MPYRIASHHARHITRARLTLGLLTALCALWAAGCGGEGGGEAEELVIVCSGHGEMHGDHCHCDPGFVLSGDGMSCVVASSTGDRGDMGDMGDMGDAPDMSPDAGQNVSDSLVFEPSVMSASTGLSPNGKQVWLLEALDGDTHLGVDLYEAYGGPTSAGTVSLGEAETSYETCGLCVVLRTGCTSHGDHLDCQRTFMPRAEGRVRVDTIGTQAGDTLSGELLDVVFQEVTISQTFQTQPVAGATPMRLATWPFSVQLKATQTPEPPCSGHGHLHGAQCHCDPGYQLDPEDSTRCIPD